METRKRSFQNLKTHWHTLITIILIAVNEYEQICFYYSIIIYIAIITRKIREQVLLTSVSIIAETFTKLIANYKKNLFWIFHRLKKKIYLQDHKSLF